MSSLEIKANKCINDNNDFLKEMSLVNTHIQ